jgi:crotonobetainyl-CoA:carnitine CoA-transferase CaiB-like acyl-CoA transferase
MTAALPLSGVRVVDFTWVIAGPQATQVLADFGAEVIRVEWRHHLDRLRFSVQPPGADPASPNAGGLWNNLNRNKLSITLNMNHPDARALALRLVCTADVVIENYSPRVLGGWGLSWEALQRTNPRLVYVSMSGFGWTGPNAGYVMFAPLMQAVSGLQALAGLPGREPAGFGFSYADHVGGFYGAIAVLAALEERDRSGAGCHVDLSQVEASLTLTGPASLEQQANGTVSDLLGNVPPGAECAPAGIYPCAGDDRWCAISVRTDDAWRRLACAVGRADLATDPRFASREGRLAHRSTLDALLATWTRPRRRDEVVSALACAGVPVSPVATAEDVVEHDATLADRGYFRAIAHPVLGPRRFQMGAISSGIGPELRTAAPLLGAHNAYVYGELLGLSSAEIASLTDDQVI